MKGILAIYRREMNGYFVSPIAYIVIGFFLVITGYFFSNILSILIERSFMIQMQAQRTRRSAGYGCPRTCNPEFHRNHCDASALSDSDADDGRLC
ncbi:MAG: hypothetical protein IPO77_04975 [Acidobacteria bacterium]|nr:hypothetical protein [Acidobacteriota bacterium]